MIVCDGCGRTVSRHETVYQFTFGWAKLRGRGGTNALALRETEDRFMCSACITRAKAVHPEQGQMEL